MARNSSAPTREQAPHETQTSKTTKPTQATKSTQATELTLTTLIRRTRTASVINALKLRALSVLNDRTLDAQSRAVIRYALETNDPWLAELVRRAEKGEAIAESFEQLAKDSV